jgi:hypothetical protein
MIPIRVESFASCIQFLEQAEGHQSLASIDHRRSSLLTGINKIIELALEDRHPLRIGGGAVAVYHLLDLCMCMGSKNEAVCLVRVGNLDNTSVCFDDKSPG